jgi:hypothetical protein
VGHQNVGPGVAECGEESVQIAHAQVGGVRLLARRAQDL